MTTEPMKYYYNPNSRAQITLWMLEEVQANYAIELIDFKKNDQKSPEFLKINPMGKIPTLVHKGTVITEAAAICAYLADAFPNKKLAPPWDDPERGSYFRWLFFAAGCVEPAITDKVNPRRDEARASGLGYGSYASTMSTLEAAVTNKSFVCGNQFSAADVYVGSQIIWGLLFKTIPEREAFTKYVIPLKQRSAYLKAEAIAAEYRGKLS